MPSAGGFATPLGTVRIDTEALDSVRDLPQVVVSDAAHAMEHSLEVQLPFLQKMLGDFALAPFAVGMASVAEVAEVIERLWGGPETLVVISTDMSHYHSYEQARAIDGATIERIAAFATDIHHEEACGATPLNGLLSFAKQKELVPEAPCRVQFRRYRGRQGQGSRLLRPSACTKAGKSLEEAGETLLSVARGSIERDLLGKPEVMAERRRGSTRPAPRSSRSPRKARCAAASAACRRRARSPRTWRRTRSARRSATRASRR